jgi:hypothetical protein
VSDAVLARVAERLGADWPKLLPKLGLDKDVAGQIEKEKEDEKERARLLLDKWANAEKEAATADELAFQLRRIGWTDEQAEAAVAEVATVTTSETVVASPQKSK